MDNKVKLIQQLSRVEGQVRGIRSMVEADRGLVATMQQFLATHSALQRAMRDYIATFLMEDGESVTFTKEQVEYILKLIK